MADPRLIPLYSIPECARYLGLPATTVRSWTDPSSGPLVEPDGAEPTAMSFTNLIEVYVLSALRRRHGVPMQRIRPAIDFLRDKLGEPRPLASKKLLTDGLDLFIEHLQQTMKLTSGQMALKEIMADYLYRVEYDEFGIASRFYPFTRGSGRKAPNLVAINPAVSFGHPVIAGSGVKTSGVASQFKAGEPIVSLANDYQLDPSQIEEAVRYELAA